MATIIGGFETGTWEAEATFAGGSSSGISISTSYARNAGGYGARFNDYAYLDYARRTAGGTYEADIFTSCRFNLYVVSLLSSGTCYIHVNHSSVPAMGEGLRVYSTGELELYVNGDYNKSTGTLPTGRWVCVEVDYGYLDGVNGATVRVDGVTWATVSTSNTAPNPIIGCWIGQLNAVSGFVFYIDDLLWDSRSFTYHNCFPGPGQSRLLVPTSDADIGSWLGGAGGSSSLYDALNNAPPVGVAAASGTNTSQIHNTNASGNQRILLNCASYASVGITDKHAINAVMPFINAAEEGASNTKAGSLALIANPAGSSKTFDFGDDAGAAGTFPSNWRPAFGGVATAPSVTLDSGPQMEVIKTTASADGVAIDAAGVYVDFADPMTPISTTGAVKLLCGFEWGWPAGEAYTSVGAVNADNAGTRYGGTYGLYCSGNNSSGIYVQFYESGAQYSSLRCEIQWRTLSGVANCYLIRWLSGICDLFLGSDNKLYVSWPYVGQFGGSTVIVTDVWYTLEVQVGWNNGKGLRVWLENTLEISIPDGAPFGADTLQVGFQPTSGTATMGVYFDDLIVFTGIMADRIGPGSIVMLMPVSDVSRSTWTGGAGGTTNLYDAMNNITPTGGTSPGTNLTQIRNVNAGGNQDMVINCQTYDSRGISGRINAVQPVILHGEEAAANTKNGSVWISQSPNQAVANAKSFVYGFDRGACGSFPTNWGITYGPASSRFGSDALSIPIDVTSIRFTNPCITMRKTTASADGVAICGAGVYVDFKPPIKKYLCGFETGSIGECFSWVTTGGTVLVGSSYSHSGSYALACVSNANGGAYVVFRRATNGGKYDSLFKSVRFYVYVSGLPSVTARKIAAFYTTSPAEGDWLKVNTDGTLSIGTGATTRATSTLTITTTRMYRIEFDRGYLPGSYGQRVYVDGQLYVSDTTAQSLPTDEFRLGISTDGVGNTDAVGMYFDDVMIQNESFAFTGFPGDSKLHLSSTTSIVNAGTWTGGAGGAVQAGSLDVVPAGTASETDATQIENATNSANQAILTAIAAIPSTSIPPFPLATILYAQAVAIHGEDAATGTKTGYVRIIANGTFTPSDTAAFNFDYGNDAGLLGTFGGASNGNWLTSLSYGVDVTEFNGTSGDPRNNAWCIELMAVSATTRVRSCCFLGIYFEYKDAEEKLEPYKPLLAQ